MVVVDNVNLPNGVSKLPDSDAAASAATRDDKGKRGLTLGELLELAVVPKRPLLGTWLREGESVLVYGATGSGKSLFALSVALAVAGGGRLLGWQGALPEDREGEGYRILIVDGELAFCDIRDRTTMLLEALPGINGKLALDGVRLFARMDPNNQGDFLSITSDAGLGTLIDLVEFGKVDLVILDNLSTLGDVEDENSAAAFNPLVKTLLALKQKGVAVILVHHAAKSGKTYRGSSKLPATMDVVLNLEVDSHKLISEARFTLSWEKSRAKGKDLLPMTVRLSSGVDDGKAQWFIEGGSGRPSQMKSMLESGRYSTQTELAKYFHVDPKTIRNDFEDGAREGLWYDGWPQDCLDAVKARQPMPKPKRPWDQGDAEDEEEDF